MLLKYVYGACLLYTYLTTCFFVAIGSICVYVSKNVHNVQVVPSPTN